MLRFTDLRKIAEKISPGDLLAFGYVHSGHDSVFAELGCRNWNRKIDVFIPCILRYRKEHFFHLDEVCRLFDGRFLITQIAPEYAPLLKSGDIDLLPLPLSQAPGYLKSEARRRKVWLFCETAPPEKGFCNTGYSAPFPLGLFEMCEAVALVKRNMPPTYGDSNIPAKWFKYFCEAPDTLPLFPDPEISETTRTIGMNAAGLIENGSLVEGGIGEVVSSVLSALSGKRNLKFRSGIMIEDMKPLIENGTFTGRSACNITGARSTGFYDWVRMNPAVEIKTMEYSHNIADIARQPGFVALGSALAVDLLGQVASETIGPSQITGVGGALDFAQSSGIGGGKSIIAMASTYGKNVSKIVPFFKKGDVVTLTRYNVDYLVTEYGVAELKYRSRRERVLNLIRVAHPDSREWLSSEAAQAGLL